MGKRNKKKKFKAKLHEQLSSYQKDSSKIQNTNIDSAKSENKESVFENNEIALVKKDVKNILIVTIILFMILAVVYYLSIKTTYITSLSQHISSFLNI